MPTGLSGARRLADDDARALAIGMLLGARQHVERGWSQGASARDVEQNAVVPWSPRATSWSIIGALTAVWGQQRRLIPQREVAIAAFQQANLALLAATGESPKAWNDAPGRKRSEALAVFDRAMSLVGR